MQGGALTKVPAISSSWTREGNKFSPRASRRNTALLNLTIEHLTSETIDLCSFLFFFFFWPSYVACEILAPQPGIEPMAPAIRRAES